MFPKLRQRIAERLDLVVELATLGEYGVSSDLRPVVICPGLGGPRPQRLRERCELAHAASSCRDGAPTLS